MSVLERHSPLAVATYPTLFGAPVVLLLAAPTLPGLDLGVGTGAWAAVGFSAVFATAFAFAAWQGGISRIGANRVLVYQYLITLTGVASGVVFFDESLGASKLLGAPSSSLACTSPGASDVAVPICIMAGARTS